MSVSRGTPGGPGGMLRAHRIEAGLTQERLADMSGLSVRTISDIECGRTARPRRSSVAVLEAALSGAKLDSGPGPATSSVVPRQLPQAVRGFVGRQRELAALTKLVRGPDGVVYTIAGTAGVGKTALALRWARDVAGGFPDGQLFVNLRGYDPDRPVPAPDALAGFLRALGVPGRDVPAGTDERAALYRSMLATRRILVVLDNACSAEQVRPLLAAAPGCLTLVTSRDALVGLIARDGAIRVNLDRLPLPDAVSLLRILIGMRADADPASAEAIAVQCSQLPLALRVAAELAARTVMPLADLVGELADEQRRLDLLDAGGDPAAGVRAVFSWSYRLLDPGAARAFRLLGLHPGKDLDRYAVAALTGTAVEQASRVLDRLARAHLVELTGLGRTGMHDLLRGYARGLAATEDTEDERRAALTRLFDHYLHTAASAMDALFPAERHRRPQVAAAASPAPSVIEPGAARAWLDAERPDLTAAIVHMAAYGWPGHLIRLAAVLLRYLEAGGHYPELRTIHGHARRTARDTGERVAEAGALYGLAMADLHQGRYRQAVDLMQQALALCREARDQIGQARALSNLGIARIQLGHYHSASVNLRQALAVYREVGDLFGEARAINNLGLVELRQGQYQQAVEHLNQALALHQQVGDQANETVCLANLGVVDLRRGRYQQAGRYLKRALALSQEIGNPINTAYSLTNLGAVDLRQGRYRQAESRLRQALILSREFGERSSEAEARNGLGEVLLAAGRPGDARAEHATALSLASQIGEVYEQAHAHSGLAASHYATGESGRAVCHWQEALMLYARLGCPEADSVRARMAAADRGVVLEAGDLRPADLVCVTNMAAREFKGTSVHNVGHAFCCCTVAGRARSAFFPGADEAAGPAGPGVFRDG
jgi:tetratricopeptide (TPR) repeat protein/transcriptional regulator with XRE-family HTH domain